MVKMTFKIDTEKLKTCKFQAPESLEKSIKVCMRICGFTSVGNNVFTSNEEPWEELDIKVFLEFENYGDIIEYLSSWTMEVKTEKEDLKRDILTMYNECRKPFFERFIKPNQETAKRKIAEEHMRQLKNKKDDND